MNIRRNLEKFFTAHFVFAAAAAGWPGLGPSPPAAICKPLAQRTPTSSKTENGQLQPDSAPPGSAARRRIIQACQWPPLDRLRAGRAELERCFRKSCRARGQTDPWPSPSPRLGVSGCEGDWQPWPLGRDMIRVETQWRQECASAGFVRGAGVFNMASGSTTSIGCIARSGLPRVAGRIAVGHGGSETSPAV